MLNVFEQGGNIDDYLSYFKDANLIRVFLYTPVKVWGAQAWEPAPFDTIVKFCDYVGKRGFYVELTLITDDDDSRLPLIGQLIDQLNTVAIPNVVIQGVNEPEVNMSTDKVKSLLAKCNYLYTSGDQEDLTKWYGTMGTYQIPRDPESPRKEKDLTECYEGGGPNSPAEVGYKVPWYDDEPIRVDEMLGFNGGDQQKTITDFYCIGANASLMGAGCIFHFTGGKFNQLPTDFEQQCYQAMCAGWKAFPPDARISGAYEHLEDLEQNMTKALRIFARGRYVIVIRPNNFVPPSGWTSIDSYGCSFIRS